MHNPCGKKKRSRLDLALLKLNQSFTHRDGLDPLLLAALVVDEKALDSQTLIGEAIHYCAEENSEDASREELLHAVRESMSSMICPVRKIPSIKLLGGRTFKVSVTGKKSEVIERFLERCEEEGVRHCCPSMVQIVFESGARVHELNSHPSEFLISCRNKLVPPMGFSMKRTEMSLVEVPNSLQLLHCFYVDWDMLVKDFSFLGGGGRCLEDLEYVRREAMKTPSVLCRLLARVGVLDPLDVVQVVVVEGTRWHKSEGCYKASIHFVFKILVTREQHRDVWRMILEEIGRCTPGDFDEVLKKRESHVVDELSRESMGVELFPLIGMDLHPYTNMEQGLALPFSRKSPSDPVSRPMCILHIKGGEEILCEVPCRQTWRAGFAVLGEHPSVECLDPTMVLCALLDCSICIPSHRCIGIRTDLGKDPGAQQGVGSTLSLRERFRSMKQKQQGKVHPSGLGGGHGQPAGGLGVERESLDPRSALQKMPGWFTKPVVERFPGIESRMYLCPQYGSRPSCARRDGAFSFQINKSPMSMCVLSLMRVPFAGHRSHRSNGSLFYVDGDDVYVSCMKSDCRSRLLQERQKHCTMAIKLHRLIVRGEEGSCSDFSEYARDILGREDRDFLERVEEMAKTRETQFDVGCEDHFHLLREEAGAQQKKAREDLPAGFAPVPPARRKLNRGRRVYPCMPCGCTPGKTLCVLDFASVPASSMCNSLDGNRTWIKLNPSILMSHLASVDI